MSLCPSLSETSNNNKAWWMLLEVSGRLGHKYLKY